jgi:hypothetical protein
MRGLNICYHRVNSERVSVIVATQTDSPLVELQILNLNQVILSYLCATTSGLRSGAGYPVFVDGAHRGNGAGRYIGKLYHYLQKDTLSNIASAPSLQTATRLLEGLTEGVQELSTEFEGVVDKLQDGGDLGEGDIQVSPPSCLKIRAYDTETRQWGLVGWPETVGGGTHCRLLRKNSARLQ